MASSVADMDLNKNHIDMAIWVKSEGICGNCWIQKGKPFVGPLVPHV